MKQGFQWPPFPNLPTLLPPKPLLMMLRHTRRGKTYKRVCASLYHLSFQKLHQPAVSPQRIPNCQPSPIFVFLFLVFCFVFFCVIFLFIYFLFLCFSIPQLPYPSLDFQYTNPSYPLHMFPK